MIPIQLDTMKAYNTWVEIVNKNIKKTILNNIVDRRYEKTRKIECK